MSLLYFAKYALFLWYRRFRTIQQCSLRSNRPSVPGGTTSLVLSRQLSLRNGRMSPSSEDIRNGTNESSARFYKKLGMISRGQRQPERLIKAKRLRYNENRPSSSGGLYSNVIFVYKG
ncbi:unnamed protein product [Protopolystoma xenopodis]|uniref:Uncharacterized protein n=1 Tax=Protopolystoma xenopodis TaxID=117903 RepID=A0A3S5BSL9_9PLAT|nr:unnamed protein product [Protopolystoma xenopodis]